MRLQPLQVSIKLYTPAVLFLEEIVFGRHRFGTCGPVMESLISSTPGVQSIDCSASVEYYLILYGGLSKPTKCHKKEHAGAANLCHIPDCYAKPFIR
jgi:hypothetical protein